MLGSLSFDFVSVEVEVELEVEDGAAAHPPVCLSVARDKQTKNPLSKFFFDKFTLRHTHTHLYTSTFIHALNHFIEVGF